MLSGLTVDGLFPSQTQLVAKVGINKDNFADFRLDF
jgi:hypothetical protein